VFFDVDDYYEVTFLQRKRQIEVLDLLIFENQNIDFARPPGCAENKRWRWTISSKNGFLSRVRYGFGPRTGIIILNTMGGIVMNKPIPSELANELEKLKDDDIARVVEFAKSLSTSSALEARNSELRKLIGSIPSDELEQMRVAIEEGCEKIEHDRW